jgi:capsular polysaccharide biosynthesis protein
MNSPFRPPRSGERGEGVAAVAPRELTPGERIARGKVLARRAFSYWKMTALVFVLGCGIAVLVAINVKRIYKSECVVLVKPAMKTDDREESPSERAMKLAPKLKDTLLTRSRLEPIIKEFNLYPRTVESKGMVDAVEEMRLHVGFRGRDSETFVISFEDEDQDRVKAITQRLADSTMDDYRKGNLSTTKTQADFLAAEEKRANDEVERANHALATFLAAHPEFAADTLNSPFTPTRGGGAPIGPGAGGGGVVMPNMPATSQAGDAALNSLVRQKARLEAEIRGATQGGAVPAPANETVASLTKARDDAAKRAAQAQADLADKRTKLTDQHPDITAAKAQAESAGRALHVAEQQLDQVKGGSAPVDTSAASPELQKKLADVQAQISARQGELARRPAKPAGAKPDEKEVAAEPVNPLVALETEWARLLRGASDAKATDEDLRRSLERARLKTSAVEMVGSDQMEIIDPAYRPTRPARGGRTNAALAGFGVAFFAAFAYAFTRVLTNDTILDAADVESLNLIPVLGVVPRLPPPSLTMAQVPEPPSPPPSEPRQPESRGVHV